MAGDKGGGKGHRKSKVGRKADKRKTAEQKKAGTLEQSQAAKASNNPRAFSFQASRLHVTGEAPHPHPDSCISVFQRLTRR